MTRLFSIAEIIAIVSGISLASIMLFISPFQGAAVPASAIVILAMVMWITIRDISDFIIPDGPLICMAIIGIASRLMLPGDGLAAETLMIAIDALVCGGALLAIRELYFRMKGVDGIGFGDVKLAAVGGILVGVIGFSWALFLASATGLVVALVFLLINPKNRFERLPFGAFLAPACWGLWMLGMLGVV